MVHAMVDIEEHTNRILNIVKAKYGLRTKSQAIDLIVEEYEKGFLEPQLRPEYVEKIRKIEKTGKFKTYNSLDALKAEIENA